MEKTFRIPESNLDRLRADFDRLAKRARRLRIEPPVLTVDDANPEVVVETQVSEVSGLTRKVVRRYFTAKVSGEAPKLPGGWTFAATLTYIEGGNIIASIVGEVPIRYRDAEPACDHCGLGRKRKETFLVVDQAGTWRQVGRNCIADFLGRRGEDPDALASMAEMLADAFACAGAGEDEGMGYGGSGRENIFHLGEFLSYVSVLIRTDGWVGRREAREKGIAGLATADRVMDNMRPRSNRDKELAKRPEARDEAKADAAIAWASELEVTNDFTHNLRLIARRGLVDPKHFGVAAYLPVAYDKAMEKIAAESAPRTVSKHFGEVGKREVYTLTVTGTRSIDGNFGVTTLVMFRDAAGNVAKWFCSGSAPEAFAVGATVVVKGTVKSHGAYQGVAETMLSRVAVHVEKTKASKHRSTKGVCESAVS